MDVVTRTSVLRVMEKYDEIGRTSFPKTAVLAMHKRPDLCIELIPVTQELSLVLPVVTLGPIWAGQHGMNFVMGGRSAVPWQP